MGSIQREWEVRGREGGREEREVGEGERKRGERRERERDGGKEGGKEGGREQKQSCEWIRLNSYLLFSQLLRSDWDFFQDDKNTNQRNLSNLTIKWIGYYFSLLLTCQFLNKIIGFFLFCILSATIFQTRENTLIWFQLKLHVWNNTNTLFNVRNQFLNNLIVTKYKHDSIELKDVTKTWSFIVWLSSQR